MPERQKSRYTAEEAAEILKRALRQQTMKDEALSHDDLLEMAAEVGIPRDALDAATVDVARERAAELARQTEARELAEERGRLLRRFTSSLIVYLCVNAGLYLIDRHFTNGSWYYWIIFAWGIGLVFQLRSIVSPRASMERRKRREQKRITREERRAARAARKQRFANVFDSPNAVQNLEVGAREFETAVQAGVAALLQAAARKIHDRAERLPTDGRRRR